MRNHDKISTIKKQNCEAITREHDIFKRFFLFHELIHRWDLGIKEQSRRASRPSVLHTLLVVAQQLKLYKHERLCSATEAFVRSSSTLSTHQQHSLPQQVNIERLLLLFCYYSSRVYYSSNFLFKAFR